MRTFEKSQRRKEKYFTSSAFI